MRAPVWTPRGRRPRHARKLLVREPGDLSPDRPEYRAVRIGKAGGPKPMMHGREKSDPAVVAMKPAKSAAQAAGELVERRAGAKGKAEQVARTGHRAGHACISNLLRLRHAYTLPSSPEVGARCLNWARRVLCGGRTATCVPTATGPQEQEIQPPPALPPPPTTDPKGCRSGRRNSRRSSGRRSGRR